MTKQDEKTMSPAGAATPEKAEPSAEGKKILEEKLLPRALLSRFEAVTARKIGIRNYEGFAILAWYLAAVTTVIGSAVALFTWSKKILAIGFALAVVLLVLGGILSLWHRRSRASFYAEEPMAHFSDFRMGILLKILRVLDRDLAEGVVCNLRFDGGKTGDPWKKTGSKEAPSDTYSVSWTFFRDKWLDLHLQLADGNALRLSITDNGTNTVATDSYSRRPRTTFREKRSYRVRLKIDPARYLGVRKAIARLEGSTLYVKGLGLTPVVRSVRRSGHLVDLVAKQKTAYSGKVSNCALALIAAAYAFLVPRKQS